MRLTLRTLLAYLDDILDPADAEKLAAKIKQSEFATGLTHTIRGVTRKLRLGAPKLTGKGMGLDPNTVAEYLDFTLPSERVPDFEKVCLESDVHLAEVASCHQILALVLGEPADVDPTLRRHIHELQASIAMPGAPTSERRSTIPPVAPTVAPQAPPPDEQGPIDETVAAPSLDPVQLPAATGMRVRLVPAMVTLFVTFLIALVVLAVMGPLDHRHPVLGRFFTASDGGAIVAQAPAGLDKSNIDAEATEQPQSPTDATGGDRQVDDSGVGQPELPAPRQSDSPSGLASDTDDSQKAVMPSGVTPDSSTADGAPAAPPDDAATGAAASSELPIPPDVTSGDDGAPAPDVGSRPPAMPAPDPIPGVSGTGGAPESDVAMPEDVAVDNTEPDQPRDAGRLMSDLQVVVRRDPTSGNWFRLSALTPLEAGDELLALPTYRPALSLPQGIQLVLVGPTRLTVGKPGADGVPAVSLTFGRIIVVTSGSGSASLDVHFGGRAGRVRFQAPESMLALEARHYMPPGEDPATFPAYHIMQMHALDGELDWQEAESEPLSIGSGSALRIVDKERPTTVDDVQRPTWLEAKSLPPIDSEASKQLEPLLVPKRPVSVSLLEQANSRLVEVRALVVRCLGLLGNYQPFIDALNDESLRSYWARLVAALRVALVRDGSHAEIRTMLDRLRGTDGQLIYRMLYGYSAQQLADDGARQLVGLLEHSALDVRVMAFETLVKITGRNHMYRPERDPKRQRRALMNWQKSLTDHEIVYRETPPAMPAHMPDAEAK